MMTVCHPLPTSMYQVSSLPPFHAIHTQDWCSHVSSFSPGCPAFFLVSHLSFWDGPLGVVPPHTYFCLVTTVTQQWESGSLAGSWRVSVELTYQQPHPYLLFHGDGLAFLCFLSQVPHQHISVRANDGEHLDTK